MKVLGEWLELQQARAIDVTLRCGWCDIMTTRRNDLSRWSPAPPIGLGKRLPLISGNGHDIALHLLVRAKVDAAVKEIGRQPARDLFRSDLTPMTRRPNWSVT
jgi:hypothetical protein